MSTAVAQDIGARLFGRALERRDGVWLVGSVPDATGDELHTNQAFNEKWLTLEQDPDDTEAWKQANYRWYLQCYGYESEAEFANFLGRQELVLDAGCGPGYKAAWFARLAPGTQVVAMDLTDSAFLAAKRYAHLPNLHVVKGDIADTSFRDGAFDFVSCDQVLHHTDSPPETLREFARILRAGGQLNTYVYAKKALPRELLDEHFRTFSKQLSHEEIWALSEQLTVLGKTLSELDIEIDVPDMPALGIPGGRQNLQRFIYWHFMKCYWNPELGFEASKMVNFDWYSPSTAFRYSREEFVAMVSEAGFRPQFVETQEACHTGRFTK